MDSRSRNGLPRSNVKKYKKPVISGQGDNNGLSKEIPGQELPEEHVRPRTDIEADRKLIERILQVGERMDAKTRSN